MKKLLVLFLFMFIPMLIGINNLTDGYRIPGAGSSLRIYAKSGASVGACYVIQNNHTTNDLFVPTKTPAEWLSFISSTQTFVTKTLCQPKSCLEIKTLLSGATDGVYTIDSDTTGAGASYQTYCDMTTDGGGWTRIFRQHVAGGYFANPADATSKNTNDATNYLYSALDKIPDFVSAGKFRFRLNWPGWSQKNIWLQSTNPMSDVVTTGVVPISVNAYVDSRISSWGGLELTNGTHGPATMASLLDGSVQHGNWHYAIGSYAAYSSPPGIPADTSMMSGGVSETVLWIKEDATYTSYNSCKAILDAGASNGSGIYTIDPGNIGSPIPVFCDMATDGGGWTRAFYHTASGALFANNAEALNSNQTMPLNTTKYSILNRLSGFFRAGKYELKMDWPASGYSARQWWSQTSDFTSQPAAGYVAIAVDSTSNFWGGLEYGTPGTTLADGSVGSGNWFYAIGANVYWGIPDGIPATDQIFGAGISAPRVQLWVK